MGAYLSADKANAKKDDIAVTSRRIAWRSLTATHHAKSSNSFQPHESRTSYRMIGSLVVANMALSRFI
jgi:hypothetical protein